MFSVDLVTEEKTMGSSVVEIFEGKLTIGKWNIAFVPETAKAANSRDGVDYYGVFIPFTLHPPATGVYRDLDLLIQLTTPGALAFDMFPKRLTGAEAEPALALLSQLDSVGRSVDQVRHLCGLRDLDLKVDAQGLGESQFYWHFASDRGLAAGAHNVCFILELPRGSDAFAAKISVQANVEKSIAGIPLLKQTKKVAHEDHWNIGSLRKVSR